MIKSKRIEMDGVCGAHGGNDKCLQNFSWKTVGRDHSEDLDVDERINFDVGLLPDVGYFVHS
jgi:hypothetical protein